MRLFRNESGQALLIVVLVMVIALTVGLSLASRSITNLRNSVDESNSQSAFSAAEAGVEQAVKLGNVTGQSILSGVKLQDKNNSQISNVDITSITGDKFLLNNGNPIFENDGTDIWLSPHQNDPSLLFASTFQGIIKLHWGTSGDITGCSDPAMEILLVTGTRQSPTLRKFAYDSCASRRTINHFSTPPESGAFSVNGANGSMTFNYRATLLPGGVTITNGLLARVIPLYKAGSAGVIAPGLPEQGRIITSTGTAGTTGVETVRKISFFQGYDSIPSELFYSLFTPATR